MLILIHLQTQTQHSIDTGSYKYNIKLKIKYRRLSEQFHNFYYSIIVIIVIKLRRMRFPGFVVYTEEMRNAYKISIENFKGKVHQENLGVGRRMILSRVRGPVTNNNELCIG
jgi:hypothetical protein